MLSFVCDACVRLFACVCICKSMCVSMHLEVGTRILCDAWVVLTCTYTCMQQVCGVSYAFVNCAWDLSVHIHVYVYSFAHEGHSNVAFKKKTHSVYFYMQEFFRGRDFCAFFCRVLFLAGTSMVGAT